MTLKEFLQGKWLGHSLHPALVHLPTALWPAALIFDALGILGVGGNPMVRLAFYCILLGLLTALLSMPAGFADFADVKEDNPAHRLGLWHMTLNLFAAAVWLVNLVLRAGEHLHAQRADNWQIFLSAIGTAILAVSGYLGGRMVYHHGVAVARTSKKKWRRIAEAGGARLPEEKQA